MRALCLIVAVLALCGAPALAKKHDKHKTHTWPEQYKVRASGLGVERLGCRLSPDSGRDLPVVP